MLTGERDEKSGWGKGAPVAVGYFYFSVHHPRGVLTERVFPVSTVCVIVQLLHLHIYPHLRSTGLTAAKNNINMDRATPQSRAPSVLAPILVVSNSEQ